MHSQKSYIYWNFFDQLLLPYKFYGNELGGILFFIFAGCEPLSPCATERYKDLKIVLKKKKRKEKKKERSSPLLQNEPLVSFKPISSGN